MKNSRAVAAKILCHVIEHRAALDKAFMPYEDHPEISFIKATCFTALRHIFIIKHIAATLSNKPLKKTNPLLVALLIVGITQIIYLSTPTYAAVSETVSAAKQLGQSSASGFVNAMLKKLSSLSSELIEEAVENNVSARYNHPPWLIKKISQAYPEQFENIIHENNTPPPLTLRVNQQRISLCDYEQKLKNAGISYITHEGISHAISLTQPIPAREIPGFFEGDVSVQDIAGQLTEVLLNPQPDDSILDVCAAPGSKTTLLLESEPNIESLVACDISAERLVLIKENIARLQLNKPPISFVNKDALSLAYEDNTYDKILLDAPCSATGVIRRHPDIKILRKAGDLTHLQETQTALLTHVWPFLKSGGVLLYATCSILPVENDRVIESFIHSNKDIELKTINLPFGQKTNFGWQLLPQTSGPDGFYYALLSKKQ